MTDTTDRVPAAQLTAGDIISFEFASGGFDTAVVSKVTRDTSGPRGVEIVRPFGIVGGFSSCAVVSFGQERLWFALDDPRLFLRLQKSDLARHEQAIMAERKAHEDEIARLKLHRSSDVKEIESLRKQLTLADEQRRAAEALALEKERSLANVKEDLRRERELKAQDDREWDRLDDARQQAEREAAALRHKIQALAQEVAQ